MEHPFKRASQIVMVIDDDDHMHGADNVLINGMFNMTLPQVGTGIVIECKNMTISPICDGKILITSM